MSQMYPTRRQLDRICRFNYIQFSDPFQMLLKLLNGILQSRFLLVCISNCWCRDCSIETFLSAIINILWATLEKLECFFFSSQLKIIDLGGGFFGDGGSGAGHCDLFFCLWWKIIDLIWRFVVLLRVNSFCVSFDSFCENIKVLDWG